MFKNCIGKRGLNDNEMYLGKEVVEITKLTPTKWKELFSVIDKVPGLMFSLFTTEPENYYQAAIQAFDIAIDEFVNIVSVMTDIDAKYIHENVGLDELIEYLTKMVELNRLDSTVKNLQSLLPKVQAE